MPFLDIVCPVCNDLFHDPDDVYGTDCGHVFHFACQNSLKRRDDNSCPQCGHYNPFTFKIFLSFDETEENSERNIELKLKKSNDKITQLHIEVVDMETNFLLLQNQFTALEQEKRDLELKIRQLQDSEENFFKLQEQYTDSSEYVKELEDRVNQLFIANEYKTKELRIRRLEKESIAIDLRSTEHDLIGSADGKRLWILEQEFRTKTEELKNEISKSSQMALENIELENYIKQINKNKHTVNTNICQQKQNSKQMMSCTNENVAKSSGSSSSLNDDCNQKCRTKTEELKNEISKSSQMALENIELENYIKQINKNKHTVNTNICQQKQNSKQMMSCTNENVAKSSGSSSILNDDCNQKYSIFIKALPLDFIVLPLENIIINLAAKMQLSIKADDLVNVEIVNDNEQESSKTKLSAEFKSIQLRNEFLSRKNLLQNHAATRSIVIREFLNQELLDLLHYAKEKLQPDYFNHFFYKNGKIFAKKTRSHPKVVLIANKSYVDKLHQKTESQENRVVPQRTLSKRDHYVPRTYHI